MAIADFPNSSFDHIRDSGFEATLESLIAYAEMQARLHQSLGDRAMDILGSVLGQLATGVGRDHLSGG